MGGIVLGLWLVQVLGGIYLWSFTTDGGRPGTSARLPTALPSLVLFLHPLVGLAGLASWVGYVQQEQRGFAWVSFGLLLVGAVLGELLLSRSRRGVRRAGVRPVATAESRMPTPVVAAHGLLALTLLVLTLLAALGVGGPIDEDEPPDGGTAAGCCAEVGAAVVRHQGLEPRTR
jgi:hypothetical protein